MYTYIMAELSDSGGQHKGNSKTYRVRVKLALCVSPASTRIDTRAKIKEDTGRVRSARLQEAAQFWGEKGKLQTLTIHNNEARVLFVSSFLWKHHRTLLRQL